MLHLDKSNVWFTVRPGGKADRQLAYVGSLKHEDFRCSFIEIEPENLEQLDRIFESRGMFVIGCDPFVHYAGVKKLVKKRRAPVLRRG